jgi:hypothetical protein
MLLVPPRSSPDSRPLYHISVSINPFIPTSSTTTVRRGASENGEHVADFEYVIVSTLGFEDDFKQSKSDESIGRWGLMRSPPVITIGSVQLECQRVMKIRGTNFSGTKVGH